MTKLITSLMIILLAASISITSTAVYADKSAKGAQEKKQGNWNKDKSANDIKRSAKSTVKFSDNDRASILNYFNSHPMPAKPLPPGIAKNLARGKPLPPGIAKKRLPPDLQSSLPAYPGYEYLLTGNNIVLANIATGIIVDILTNALK